MAKTKTKSASKSTTKASNKAKSTSTAKAKTTKARSAKTTGKSKTATKTKTGLSKLDETGNRTNDERRKVKEAAPAEQRKAPRRRRQIDPTTCERDYTEQEIQFMHAMDEYKQLSGRMFPTCSEILEVLNKLGYRQIADAQLVYDPNAEVASSDDEESLEDGDEVESCI